MMGDKLLFENVSKIYGEGDNKVTALDNISLNVRAGNSSPSWVHQAQEKVLFFL